MKMACGGRGGGGAGVGMGERGKVWGRSEGGGAEEKEALYIDVESFHVNEKGRTRVETRALSLPIP